jgi:hypothetical protein
MPVPTRKFSHRPPDASIYVQPDANPKQPHQLQPPLLGGRHRALIHQPDLAPVGEDTQHAA